MTPPRAPLPPPPSSPVKLPDYDEVALVLQGGGALGSYQAGVYEGLHEAGVRPTWLAGTSIGAINTAIIAGSPPEERVERLRGFWESICRAPLVPLADAWLQAAHGLPFLPDARTLYGGVAASQALLMGQPGFFSLRVPPPYLTLGAGAASTSFYDTAPLEATLRRYVDFDMLNSGKVRASVSAVNVRTGNLEYFDTTQMRLDTRHIMASGALPPGFAAVEIDGEYYWDGGVVSNTPLTHVVSSQPSRDTLAFQVDLWPARGPLPEDLTGVSERQKDIQYSSRTRTVTNQMERIFQLKHGLQRLLDLLPPDQRNAADLADLRALSCAPVYNIVHLIYQSKPYERHSKDYEFGMDAMRDHWASGLTDMRDTLTQPRYLDKPSSDKGFATHDVHRNQL